MIYQKSCPKCSGDVELTAEILDSSTELHCIQCGWRKYSNVPIELTGQCEGSNMLALAGSVYANSRTSIIAPNYGRCSVCNYVRYVRSDGTVPPHVFRFQSYMRPRSQELTIYERLP